MAEEYYNGRKTLLFLDEVTPIDTPIEEVTTENAVMVACLTENGFQGTTSEITVSNKCTPGNFKRSIGGELGFAMTAAGHAVGLSVGDLRKNHNALFKLWKSQKHVWAFMMDADSTEDSITIRYGVVRIDTYNDTWGNNELQGFDIGLTGDGEPGDQDDILPVA